jgi:transcriptional regulator with XRE-family HTH domain
MPPLRKDFGQRLRAIRLERSLTQERFAEMVGISVDFLSLIERGINAPSFETIEQLANRLRVPVKALFDFPERRAAR